MRFILSSFVVFLDPLRNVTFLDVSRLHDGWRVQRIFMPQVQVMGAIFYQHGNETVGDVLGNPAC